MVWEQKTPNYVLIQDEIFYSLEFSPQNGKKLQRFYGQKT
jgi:hypothetical protein